MCVRPNNEKELNLFVRFSSRLRYKWICGILNLERGGGGNVRRMPFVEANVLRINGDGERKKWKAALIQIEFYEFGFLGMEMAVLGIVVNVAQKVPPFEWKFTFYFADNDIIWMMQWNFGLKLFFRLPNDVECRKVPLFFSIFFIGLMWHIRSTHYVDDQVEKIVPSIIPFIHYTVHNEHCTCNAVQCRRLKFNTHTHTCSIGPNGCNIYRFCRNCAYYTKFDVSKFYIANVFMLALSVYGIHILVLLVLGIRQLRCQITVYPVHDIPACSKYVSMQSSIPLTHTDTHTRDSHSAGAMHTFSFAQFTWFSFFLEFGNDVFMCLEWAHVDVYA